MRTPEELKGRDGVCETVKIKSGDGFTVINAEDFDKSIHELYAQPAGAEEQKPIGKKKK